MNGPQEPGATGWFSGDAPAAALSFCGSVATSSGASTSRGRGSTAVRWPQQQQHGSMFEASAGGIEGLHMFDPRHVPMQTDPGWAAFDASVQDGAESEAEKAIWRAGLQTAAAAGSCSGGGEFQMATSSGSGSGSGSGSEARSASDSSTSNTESSDDSVDSGEEMWNQAKVNEMDVQAVFGSSSDAIEEAYKVARSLKPPSSRLPTMPEPDAPLSKSVKKDLRKLKRAAKAEAVQARKRFVDTHTRKVSLGNYRLPTNKPAMLLTLTAPHTIVDVNSEWCRWCCFSRDEAIGQTYTLTHGAGTEQARVARMNSAMQAGVGCIAVLT